jgi:protease-4
MGSGVSRPRAHRLLSGALAIGLALGSSVAPTSALAGPNDGEARSILRDTDRVYTTVAGEADGAAVVMNPANLGFLRGVNGVLDFAWTRQGARRRGSGVGAFVGVPLPFQILSLGLGYQFLYPKTPTENVGGDPEPQGRDESFSKITFAIAVPLMRWARGLSIGMNVSRLVSSQNFHANGVTQVDVAIAWWATRFLALGFVARGVNVPRTGPADGKIAQPYVLDPELALRPLGTPAIELGAGVRISPFLPIDPRFRTFRAEPRGRLLVTVRGVRFFAEAERFRFFPEDVGGGAEPHDALRLTAGFGLDLGHFGMQAGATTSAGGADTFAADGGVLRVRGSQERYESVVRVRPRVITRLDLSEYSGDRGMWKLVETIDELARHNGVVLLETRGVPFSFAQLEEIREALIRLRAGGGRVVAYMEGGGLRSYFIASVADRIIGHPNAGIEILGMRIQSLHYANLLSKFGAKAEFVRVAEYKGWADKLHLAKASEPVARQRMQLYTDIWNHALRVIARDRGQDPLVVKEWIDDAPHTPQHALREGIVDELAFPDELDERLEKWLVRKVRIEKPSKQKDHPQNFGPGPRIAVLLVEGDLVDGESFTIPLLGRKIAGAETLTREIQKLRKDPGVRAVVVRCNTPGGSVAASDAIARELDLTRKEKPVVISMSHECASGGYYIATGGQYIFADATTFTGSIGVFFPKVDISGTLEKFGVTIDRFEFGRRAGLRSWLKPYTDDEREAALRDIEASYGEFATRVARVRSMGPEEVDAVARGRVWSGVRAIDVGLVDAYGGLREAVLRARAIAGLRLDEGTVVIMPKPPGILTNLRSLLGFKLPNPLNHLDDGSEGGFAPQHRFSVGTAMALALPPAIVRALRYLPVNLWLVESPAALALAEETLVLED